MSHEDKTKTKNETEPKGHSPTGASTATEFLVRESLSDEENRLTADHHLGADRLPKEDDKE